MALRQLLGCATTFLAIQLLFLDFACAEMIHLEPDTINSEIKATVTEPLSSFRDHPTTTGTFRLLTGEIEGDPNSVAATGRVKLVIDATTYESGSLMRDRNVISSSLETGRYPSIEFDSTRLENVQIDTPGVSGNATVVGNLALHGVIRPISVPVDVSMTPDGEFTARGEFTFNYTDYGIKTPRLLFALPADHDVTIAFHIRARRPGAMPSPSPTP